MKTTRQHALKALIDVIHHGHSWERTDFSDVAEGERGFAKALCLGVIRHYEQLLWISTKLIKKPLKNKDIDVLIIVLMGLYEIWQMQTPDYAAIDETVNVVPKRKQWAKGLVNATLHRFVKDFMKLGPRLRGDDSKNGDALNNETPSSQAPRTWDPGQCLSGLKIPCLPEWIILALKKDYPNQLKSILAETQKQPPQHCRVNQQKISVANYIKQYCTDIEVETHADFPDALTFKKPRSVDDIPGFFDGLISIQDLAPQQTPYHLDLKSGMHVLDACAAPGGKTGHLLEVCPDIHLTAWDIDPIRLERVQDNLERLGLLGSDVELMTQDATSEERHPNETLSQEPHPDETHSKTNNTFDRILIDAPCSGLGVVRRHPDIKLHRTPEDIENLSKTQLQILTSLWPQLKPGGKLLYATCSIFKAENDEVINAFLKQTSDAKLEMSKQFLPTANGPDGFYYALLTKQ